MSIISRIALVVLSCASVTGCLQKKALIHDKVTGPQAAIQTTKTFFKSVQGAKVENTLKLIALPLWFDGTIFTKKSEAKKELGRSGILRSWKLTDATFHTQAQAEVFAKRFINKLKKNKMPHADFVVLKFNVGQNRKEELIFSLVNIEQQWKITGMEDQIHSVPMNK